MPRPVRPTSASRGVEARVAPLWLFHPGRIQDLSMIGIPAIKIPAMSKTNPVTIMASAERFDTKQTIAVAISPNKAPAANGQ